MSLTIDVNAARARLEKLSWRSIFVYGWRLVFGEPVPSRLPDRVRAEIEATQQDSEILVGWLQVCAIGLFGTLYAVSKKSFPQSIPFEPVPLALGLYSLFTFARLWLAYRHRLPKWILSLSVVIDVTVLMVTIWSFHLQYHAPPGLYLKAPTLLYVFILIALRTLRFEPFYILLTGASAVAGWTILVAVAALDPINPARITRDYLEYMMSFDLLVGAEIDKIIAIMMVTFVLFVAVVRARKLLIRTAVERTAAADLSRFFSRDVAARIRNAQAEIKVGQGEVRHAAILSLDLRGFTKLSRHLTPCGVLRLLEEYQARFVPIIERHGGGIDKFLGDGILVSFGTAAPSQSYAADALASVREIMIEAQAWNADRAARDLPPVDVGAAVAVGELVLGTIGHGERLEFTVIGDPVNLSAKLEKHTKSLRVRALTTLDALTLALDQGFAADPSDRIFRDEAVAGVAHSLDLVALA